MSPQGLASCGHHGDMQMRAVQQMRASEDAKPHRPNIAPSCGDSVGSSDPSLGYRSGKVVTRNTNT